MSRALDALCYAAGAGGKVYIDKWTVRVVRRSGHPRQVSRSAYAGLPQAIRGLASRLVREGGKR